MNNFMGIVFTGIVFSVLLIPFSNAAQPDIWKVCDKDTSHTTPVNGYYCCYDGTKYQWQTNYCTLPTLTYPSNTWQRLWYTVSGTSPSFTSGNFLGAGPDETSVNFDNDWGGSVIAYGKSDNIGFRSSRTINIPSASNYRFTVGSDDGVRLYIDDMATPKIDKWVDRGYTQDSVTLLMSQGDHRVLLEYYENGGGARVSFNYGASDTTPPTTSVNNVEGDASSPYYDTSNDGDTNIVVNGEANMACRWYTTDDAYAPSSGTACTVSGSQATCIVSTSSGSYTRYVACADSLGNGQSNNQNLDISWTVDYTLLTFTIQYYSDSSLTTPLGNNPKLKAGTYYIKITANKALQASPTISISAEGTANDVSNAATTLHAGNDYKYTRTIATEAAAVGTTLEDISITGTDVAGNLASNANPTNEATKASYTDTTIPTTTATATGVSSPYTITLTCTDASGCKETKYCTDTTNSCTPSTVYSASFPQACTAATCYVRYYSTDNANNQETSKFTQFGTGDVTPPTGSININSGVAYINSTSTTLTLSCSDVSGCSQMKFSNDGATWSASEAYSTTKSWTLTSGDGTKTVYALFSDTKNNWMTTSVTDTIILDTTPPTRGTYTLNSLSSGPVYTSGSLTHAWSGFGDSGSGLYSFEIWRAAYNPINCKETDTSGCNWGAIAYHLDTTNPATGSWSEAVSNDYMYGWHSSDKAGNYIREITPFRVVYDATPPTVTISYSPTSPTSSQQMTFTTTATDNVSVTSIKINVDGTDVKSCTTSPVSPCTYTGGPYSSGAHTYYATASDAAGNSGRDPSSGTRSFTVSTPDTTPPSCSISSITESSIYAHVSGTTIYYSTASTGSFTVTVSSTDAGSGVQKVNFPDTVSSGGDDTSSPYEKTYNWDAADTFDSSATATCYDNAGNTNTASFTVDKDITSPSGVSISYTDGYYKTTSVPISLSTGTDSEAGVNTASDFIERQDANLLAGSCGSFGSWSPVKSDPGATYTDTVTTGKCYKYRYTISDNVNNAATHVPISTAKVDTTPPSVGQATVYSGSTYNAGVNYWYKGTISIRASASDSESGIFTCEYTTDNDVTWSAATYDSINGVCKKDSISPTTDVTINLRATNGAGLPPAPGTSRIYVRDVTAPTTSASATSPPGGASYTFGTKTKDDVQVTLSCGDNIGGSGCYTTKYCIDTLPGCTTYTTGTTFTISNAGIWYVRFYSDDNVGNPETPKSRTVEIDRTPPIITITGVAGDTISPYMTTDTTPDIVLGTDEQANCRYSTTANTAYDSMTGIFSPTPPATGISHTTTLPTLSPAHYTYYARCSDTVSNKNLNDKDIPFDICTRSNPTVAITPKEQSGEPGDTKAYTLQVTNNDQNCGTETFSLTTIGCPTGWTCTLPSPLSIVSGSSSSTTLSITSSSSATEGVNVVNVEAKNAAADLYKSTASATYKLICVYRLAIKQTTNFDTSAKQGRYDGIKYTWALSFADSSSSSCTTTAGKIKYTIPSLQLSGSCDSRETGVYTSGSNPPTGVKLSTPYDFSVSRSGSLDNAFKVYLKKSGLNSCTLSFPIKVGGLEVDPSFIVSPGASRQSPHVSLFDFSGDKNSLNVKWDAFYPDDEPFRDMKVKCSVFNPTDNKCDPELEDCSIITGKGCLPYDASQGSQDVKKGSCDVSSPALDLTKDNKIICLFYDPSNTNLKTRVEPSFKPIDFAAQMADKITTTVGKKFDLKIDISNNGTLTDSYKIELSGSGTVDISPVTITTPTIDRNQIVSTFSSITPLVDQSGVVTVKITSLASGKVVTKEIEVAPGLFALPEFGLIGFLQIVAIAAVIYFLLFSRITPKKKKRR